VAPQVDVVVLFGEERKQQTTGSVFLKRALAEEKRRVEQSRA